MGGGANAYPLGEAVLGLSWWNIKQAMEMNNATELVLFGEGPADTSVLPAIPAAKIMLIEMPDPSLE
jgi:hypothetical protein